MALTFAAMLAFQLTGVPALEVVGSVCIIAALAIIARYTWTRLTTRGKALFASPVLLALCWVVFKTLALPGAHIVGYLAFTAWIVAIGYGVRGRAAATSELAIARSGVDPSLLRSEAPAERIRVVLDDGGVHLEGDDPADSELWPIEDVSRVDLDAAQRVLRITDRVGDDFAVELHSKSRTEAEELVSRLQARQR